LRTKVFIAVVGMIQTVVWILKICTLDIGSGSGFGSALFVNGFQDASRRL
jgi:hypothetical protein